MPAETPAATTAPPTRRRPSLQRPYRRLPRADWPRGWRIVEEGRFGETAPPVLWVHLDAGEIPVDEAARLALDALQAIGGELRADDLTYLPEQERAVGQLDAVYLRASLEAYKEHGHTRVRVSMLAWPGRTG